jgi:hypothetical protein
MVTHRQLPLRMRMPFWNGQHTCNDDGIVVPTAGCGELTGDYNVHTLTFTVSVERWAVFRSGGDIEPTAVA